MDETQKEAAIEWLQANLTPTIVDLSEAGAQYLLDKWYPGGYTGFMADLTAGYKS